MSDLEKRLRDLANAASRIGGDTAYVDLLATELADMLREAARIGAEMALRRVCSKELMRQAPALGPDLTCAAMSADDCEATLEGLFDRRAEIEREECARRVQAVPISGLTKPDTKAAIARHPRPGWQVSALESGNPLNPRLPDEPDDPCSCGRYQKARGRGLCYPCLWELEDGARVSERYANAKRYPYTRQVKLDRDLPAVCELGCTSDRCCPYRRAYGRGTKKGAADV